MSENTQNSIFALERESAGRSAAQRAAQALAASGVEGADETTIDLIGQQVSSFQALRDLYGEFTRGLAELQDDPDLTDEQRQDRYVALRDQVDPQYAELSRRVRKEIEEKRAGHNRFLFGSPDASSGATDPIARHVGAMNYRDALSRLTNASDVELEEAAELAKFTGDSALLRAAAAIADRRGNNAVVYKYLGESEQRMNEYVLRNSLPTDTTVGILLNAFRPPAVSKDQVKPSLIAIQERKRREEAARRRRLSVFQR